MKSQREKRPWLAALLGTLATGLGHFYLRRWRRGLGWFVAAVAASVFFVPPEATQALLSGEADLAPLAPVLAVGVASVVDAYVLARNQQRRARSTNFRPAGESSEGVGGPIVGDDDTPSAAAAVPGAPTTDETCPHCGKELDPELDFCPWCTTRLSGESDD
jgi:hypothetical protein